MQAESEMNNNRNSEVSIAWISSINFLQQQNINALMAQYVLQTWLWMHTLVFIRDPENLSSQQLQGLILTKLECTNKKGQSEEKSGVSNYELAL